MKVATLLLITALALGGEARADDGTWCVAGFAKGPSYGKTASATTTAQDACAALASKKKFWHFHGFVVKGSACYSCWDEESNTCETAAPSKLGFRFVGASDCRDAVPAPVGEMKHVDPKAPPASPKAPAKPAPAK